MTRHYRTIAGQATAQIEVKRSRFLCELTRVETEEAARAVIASARSQHWDARHHCSAFVIGPEVAIERSSDDGEPAGTAGAPMLEVLRGADLSDVVAVVTRWFGGTLLGAGGLVRAYSDAVRAAVQGARIQRRDLLIEVEVGLGPDGYTLAGRFESDVRDRGITVVGATYAREVTFVLAAPDLEALTARVAELTAGSATTRPLRTTWVDA